MGVKSHVKEVSTGGDGSPDVVEQVTCIHWWPCSCMGVGASVVSTGGGQDTAC